MYTYTAVLHFLYSSFKWKSLAYSGLLQWVDVQTRLKTTVINDKQIKISRCQ